MQMDWSRARGALQARLYANPLVKSKTCIPIPPWYHSLRQLGLSSLAVCNSRSRFLEMSIIYPGSTSDFRAFEGMTLFTWLENGLLALVGLCSWQHQILQPPVGAKTSTIFSTHSFVYTLSALLACLHIGGQFFACHPSLPQVNNNFVIALAKFLCFCLDESDIVPPPVKAVDERQTEMWGDIPLETTRIFTSEDQKARSAASTSTRGWWLPFADVDQGYRCSQIRQSQS